MGEEECESSRNGGQKPQGWAPLEVWAAQCLLLTEF